MTLSYVFEDNKRWSCKATEGQTRKAKAKAKTFLRQCQSQCLTFLVWATLWFISAIDRMHLLIKCACVIKHQLRTLSSAGVSRQKASCGRPPLLYVSPRKWVSMFGFPSNTMWPGPRPTSLPSGILIHPTVWPQLPECHAPPRRNTLKDYFLSLD